MERYRYTHSRGESFYATEREAFDAREANAGRGIIFRVNADGTETCIG